MNTVGVILLILLIVQQICLTQIVWTHRRDARRRLTDLESLRDLLVSAGTTVARIHVDDHDGPIILDMTLADLAQLARYRGWPPIGIAVKDGKARMVWAEGKG